MTRSKLFLLSLTRFTRERACFPQKASPQLALYALFLRRAISSRFRHFIRDGRAYTIDDLGKLDGDYSCSKFLGLICLDPGGARALSRSSLVRATACFPPGTILVREPLHERESYLARFMFANAARSVASRCSSQVSRAKA